jgi:hypothetical protein
LRSGEKHESRSLFRPLLLLVIVGYAPGWAVAQGFSWSLDAFNTVNPRWTPFPNYTAAAYNLFYPGIHGFVAGAFASNVMQWIVKDRVPRQKYIMPTVVVVGLIAAVMAGYALIINQDFLNTTLLGGLVQLGANIAGLFFRLSK